MVDVATLVGTVATNYIQYVFGSPVLTGLGFLFLFIMIGIRFNWGIDLYIVTMLPLISYMAGSMLGTGIHMLVLLGIGFIIGIVVIVAFKIR